MKTLIITLILFLTVPFAATVLGQEIAPNPAPAVSNNTVIDGKVGPGSSYRLFKPANWNGGLVLFAHGALNYTAPPFNLDLANTTAAWVTAHGYAFAISTFSENGWAVKDGAQRTHQLVGIFAEQFGTPDRVYLMGGSMGGLIAIQLAEQFPHQFVGVLATCPPSGGTRMQQDYVANVRSLFDLFYPDVLPGDAVSMPPGTIILSDIQNPAIAALTADPSGGLKIASIDQSPVEWSNLTQLTTSIVSALNLNAMSSIDYFPAELQGRSKFENRRTQYTSATLPSDLLADINLDIARYAAAPSALNYMEKYYNPTGNLRIPMVILKNPKDPTVPGIHLEAYTNRVAAAGHSSLLYHRFSVRPFGHCNFDPNELESAFVTLTNWVEQGIPPTP